MIAQLYCPFGCINIHYFSLSVLFLLLTHARTHARKHTILLNTLSHPRHPYLPYQPSARGQQRPKSVYTKWTCPHREVRLVRCPNYTMGSSCLQLNYYQEHNRGCPRCKMSRRISRMNPFNKGSHSHRATK